MALQSLSSAQTSTLFSTTTTAPGLTPGANGVGSTSFLNGAGAWTVPAGGVPTTRTLQGTAPIAIGGVHTAQDLSANRVISILAASTTVVGASRLATTAEATAQSLATVAVTPAGLADRVLTSRTISTTAPLSGGGALTGNLTLTVGAASETAVGVVELATTAEATTGTDTTRAITAAGLKAVADTKPASTTVDTIWTGNQAAYDAIGTKDSATLYFVTA